LGVDRSSRKEKKSLGARNKLNSIYFGSSVAIAGIIGGLTGSWTVFVVTAGVLIACSLGDGGIRPNKRRRR
jgi:hypothetical protein